MTDDDQITRACKEYSRSVHRSIAVQYYVFMGVLTAMAIGFLFFLAYLVSQT